MILFNDYITSLSIDEENGFAYVELNKPLELTEHDHSKRFIGSCCGKSRRFYFKSDVKTAKTVRSQLSISVNQCYSLMEQLQDLSMQFIKTGVVHNAAIATIDNILAIRTDIGLHNALDNVYCDIFNNRRPLKDKFIV